MDRALGQRYRLLGRIGSGGMGEVHEAVDESSGEPVAVKVLTDGRAADPRARLRFEREISLARKIDHPSLCPVLDHGEEEGRPFLVMPRLQGETLAARVARGPLPVDEACRLVDGILEGLEAAHSCGLVHRDLKPDNVFLVPDGAGSSAPVILDFGISKPTREGRADDREPSSITRTGTVLGTPSYMAPEQARGERSLGPSIDVYAAGATFYEMLTGRRAFEGAGYNDILWKIWNTPLTRPRAHRPEIPSAVEAVVLRAMAKNPAERFASARAMAQALAVALETGPPATSTLDTLDDVSSDVTPAPTTRESAGRGSSSRPTAASVVLGVPLLLISVAALAVFAPTGERHPRGVVEPPEQPFGDALGQQPAADEGSPEESPLSSEQTAGGGEVGGDESTGAPVVRITLSDVPEGSTVLVDGRPVPGPVIELPAEGEPVAVEVRAPGYESWRRQLAAGATRTVQAHLRRRGRAPRRDGPPRPATDESPESEAPIRGLLTTFGEVP